MNNPIKFGTDGWRATPSTGLSNKNIMICAQAFSDYINKNISSTKEILVGYDTRKNSYNYAKISAQVIKSNEIDVKLTSVPTPTPICSHHVKNSLKSAGVIITASHNSKEWNGFKVRSSTGMSLKDNETKEIEQRINFLTNNESRIKFDNKIHVEEINIIDEYINSIEKIIDIESINNSGLSIVVDYMHGAVSGVVEKILNNKNNIFLRKELNPDFPGMKQPEPVEENLSGLKKAVKQKNFSVGLVFDGDGDRLGVVDENGNFQLASEVFSILSKHVLSEKKSVKSIGTTVTMSSTIDALCNNYNAKVFRTKVGFKYLAPLLETNKVSFAGEESGGYSINGHVSDKDGILSALLYLECLAKKKIKPSELLEEIHEILPKRYFDRIDVAFSQKDRKIIEDKIIKLDSFLSKEYKIVDLDNKDGKKIILEDSSWILVRLSGTEPVFRIYVESENELSLDRLKNNVLIFFNL